MHLWLGISPQAAAKIVKSLQIQSTLGKKLIEILRNPLSLQKSGVHHLRSHQPKKCNKYINICFFSWGLYGYLGIYLYLCPQIIH